MPSRRAWKQKRERFHEIDSFAPSLSLAWWTATLSPELSCQEAWWWWVRWGEARRGWGLTAAALWHFCTASRWVEANSNLSHEPCALRQGHYQPGRLVVSSGPLNEAFVISLRATREGECSSAAFCWQELSEACSFLTDSCPVTASYKTVWYDSLSIDASEGYQWLRGKCHQVRVDHKWLKGQLFNNADSFDLICPGFEISVSYCFSLFLMKFWWKLFTLTFVD